MVIEIKYIYVYDIHEFTFCVAARVFLFSNREDTVTFQKGGKGVVRRYKGAHFSVQLGFSHHMAGK